MSAPRLILASRSPRRALLLGEAGYVFEQLDPPFEDPPQPASQSADASAVAEQLAVLKAQSAADHLRARKGAAACENAVIIAADTVCVDGDGGLIGQATDKGQARAILCRFIGREHEVVTAVALLGPSNRLTCFFDRVAVAFGQIGDDELDAYVDTGQWRGKAGAYNLFERQVAGWPITVDPAGDPATVVGLPMRQLRGELSCLGIWPQATRGAATVGAVIGAEVDHHTPPPARHPSNA